MTLRRCPFSRPQIFPEQQLIAHNVLLHDQCGISLTPRIEISAIFITTHRNDIEQTMCDLNDQSKKNISH